MKISYPTYLAGKADEIHFIRSYAGPTFDNCIYNQGTHHIGLFRVIFLLIHQILL